MYSPVVVDYSDISAIRALERLALQPNSTSSTGPQSASVLDDGRTKVFYGRFSSQVALFWWHEVRTDIQAPLKDILSGLRPWIWMPGKGER